MGVGEAGYLSGKRKMARIKFLQAAKLADDYGFKLEKGYAQRLLKVHDHGRGFPVNLP
jgi:hypothetical protein